MALYETLRAMKVVLVEDNEIVRENVALYFKVKGCLVKTFENAEDAADSFDVESPDLVISDFLLPGRDGLAFLKQLAHDHPRTKKVLVTAYPRDLLADEVGLAGIDALIIKPFTVEEMEGVLEQVIGTGTRITG